MTCWRTGSLRPTSDRAADATRGIVRTSQTAAGTVDTGLRSTHAVAPNVLDRTFTAASVNRKWVADFTHLWTAEGWFYVAAVVISFRDGSSTGPCVRR
jgi:transposase InsO family protein